jgi:microcystin-dependent protein
VTGAITAPDLTEVMKQLKALQARVEVPVGTIMPYGGGGDPTNRAELAKHGWLFCDGALLSQSLDSGLYNAIGTAFGGTKDSFNLPDLRGRFVRGVDDSTGRDPDASARTASNSGGNRDDNVGSVQNDTFKSHTHKYVSPVQWSNNSGNQMEYGGDIRAKQEWETESTGGDETRPKNVYVNWIIKARPSK